MRKRHVQGLHETQESDGINLTPLLDVVFVVLIMFILIAPMLELDRINLAKGTQEKQKESKAIQENNQILIYVREDNSIWLSSKKTSLDELSKFLIKARKEHPQQIPQLFHDKKAHFGTYQSIKNLVESSGFEELDVILQP